MESYRILVIDDNLAIHQDFEKVLCPPATSTATEELNALDKLFGQNKTPGAFHKPKFIVDAAMQGREGSEKVLLAKTQGNPYAVVFVDIRMPPGWDGIETIQRLWEIDPDVQAVICSAYSDHTWESMAEVFGPTDQLLILRKPFERIEVLQLAVALSKKWSLNQRDKARVGELEKAVEQRTAALQDANQELEAILVNAPDFILKIRPDLAISYVNRAEITGLREAAIGKNICQYATSQSEQSLETILLSVFRDRLAVAFDSMMQVADGSKRWFANRVAPLLKEGAVREAIYFASEITEQRKLEEQFRQSQKMEAIGRLASGIAHDFNNLLTVNLMYTDRLLLRDDMNSECKAMVQEIYDASIRASMLTKQLLTFGRQQSNVMAKVDLNKIVSDMKTLLERTLGEDIKIELSLSPGPQLIWGDLHQIGQILLNLAVNSRDALPKGGTFRIETSIGDVKKGFSFADKPSFAARDYVCLAVSDTGMGMPKEVQEHIFEPFFTTKGEGKGTGLGLSMVYGIVQQHQGYIAVQSEADKGTLFEIYFPKTLVDETQPTVYGSKSPPLR